MAPLTSFKVDRQILLQGQDCDKTHVFLKTKWLKKLPRFVAKRKQKKTKNVNVALLLSVATTTLAWQRNGEGM